MSVVLALMIYLAAGIGLTAVVGRALARSGRAFLLDVFGNSAALAEAVTRLLVVGFYLLSLGFVALTVGMPGTIGNASQAVQLLSVKVGELLLVLGALYFATLVVFSRLRRSRARTSAPVAGPPSIPSDEGPVSPPLWRAGRRQAAL
ncbi:MAG TPA: hypothetical protein VGS19_08385 [Streptosporangiaceae bacterium]|nr:hypothetical protein [Streptosporangiaceae bacterium]